MTEWWSVGYPGGPMVDLPGFPRPLYPPDAAEHGKKPSMDGPDIVAYKRTVSRAGRWPWQAFDDAYSNAFAHGKSGNVGESGVAGVQRQLGLEPTGWIGEKTFNGLRSIRIPEGLPHAGEPAMDALAQSLLVDAWDLFHGSPTPAPEGSSARARLTEAKSWIGYVEDAGNLTEFGEWYGMDGQPWCAMFVTYADAHGGNPAPATFKKGSRYAYVPYMLDDAEHYRYGLQLTTKPAPGDVVMFDWEANGVYDHVGLFEGWLAGSTSQFNSIEGNTSVDSQSNGGQVMRRTRSVGAGVKFARIEEP